MECMYIQQICMQAGVDLTIVFALFFFFLNTICQVFHVTVHVYLPKHCLYQLKWVCEGEKKEVWHSVEPLGQSHFSLNVMYPDWLRSLETSVPLTRSSCCGSLTGPTKYSHTDSLGPVLTSSSYIYMSTHRLVIVVKHWQVVDRLCSMPSACLEEAPHCK